VNRLAQFLQYTTKVFGLKALLRRVGDGRSEPQVPLLPLVLCLMLGVVIRIGSYLDLAEQTQSRRRWRHLCGLKAAVHHEIFAYVTERMAPEDWRQNQAAVAKQLKANKALESCKLKGLLFLSIDANEHFASFSRTCPRCCQRQVEQLDSDAKKLKVTQYYHRYVFAHLSGPKFNLVLDVEPILPGEDECAAALRLLGRIRRLYGPRFFDGITADAWYAKGPFLRALDKLGWLWVVVLKREDMDVFKEAVQLSKNQKPAREFRDESRQRQVRLWKVKDLHFSDGYTQGKSVQVIRAEESWTQRSIQGGHKRAQAQQSQWVWVACEDLLDYPPELIYQAGHRRWGIENQAFNELTQAYHLTHCYHHDPTSMLVQMLILIFAFTLFSAFALHSQLVRLGQLTRKALAHQLDLALEEDLPWDLWFHTG
jgi:DDE family transposase